MYESGEPLNKIKFSKKAAYDLHEAPVRIYSHTESGRAKYRPVFPGPARARLEIEGRTPLEIQS